MKKKLKVNEVLSTGRSMVIFPVAIVIFVVFGAVFYFVAQKQLPNWVNAIGIVLSLVLGWLCWRFMVARWKTWAFSNVKNLYQLKKRVSYERLLWPSVGFFTEATPKFVKPGDLVLPKDSAIPKEIAIYYSKRKNFTAMFFWVLFIFILAFAAIKGEAYGALIICVILGYFSAYPEYKEATNVQPQIIINNNGIWTIRTGFKSWNEINNDGVRIIRDPTTTYYLAYDYSGGREYLQIDDYNVGPWTLEVLLHVYRERHNEKK